MSASAKAKKAARAAVAAMTPVERFSGKRKDFRLWFVRLQASMHRKGIKLDEAALAGMDDADLSLSLSLFTPSRHSSLKRQRMRLPVNPLQLLQFMMTSMQRPKTTRVVGFVR